jgi:hypothetical protein
MPAERGIATLLAFACALQATAHDDVLDVVMPPVVWNCSSRGTAEPRGDVRAEHRRIMTVCFLSAPLGLSKRFHPLVPGL